MNKKTMQILSLSVASLFVASTAMAFHGAGVITGVHNDIDIEQVGDTNHSVSTQQGFSDQIDIFQKAVGGENDSLVHQEAGNGNKLNITQDTTNNPAGADDDNRISVVQTGTDNEASVDQDTNSTDSTKGKNYVKILQTGNTNKLRGAEIDVTNDVAKQDLAVFPDSKATQVATNGDNSMIVQQDGNANQAGLYQKGAAGNTANIFQKGADTLASFQTSTGAAFGNHLDVDQLGTSAGVNSATNLQDGPASHSYTLCQTATGTC